MHWQRGKSPLRLQAVAKSLPRLLLQDHPKLLTQLGLQDAAFVDVYNSRTAEWLTLTFDCVINIDKSHRLLLRARPSPSDAIDDDDCPELEVEKSKLSVSGGGTVKRMGEDLASTLVKAPRTVSKVTFERQESVPESRATSPPNSQAIDVSQVTHLVTIPPRASLPSTSRAPSPPVPAPAPVPHPSRDSPVHTRPVTSKRKHSKPKKHTITDVQLRVYRPGKNLHKPVYPHSFYVCDVEAGEKWIEATIEVTDLTQEELFPQVFKGIKYARTTINKYRALRDSAPAEIQDRYRQYGRQEKGLFEAFIKEVSPPRPKGPKAKTVTIAVIDMSDDESQLGDEREDSALSDDEHDRKTVAARQDTGEDLSLEYIDPEGPVVPQSDPASLCPFCDDTLPVPLPADLAAQLEDLVKKSEPDPSIDNSGHRKMSNRVGFKGFISFCHSHRAALVEIPKAQSQGWPTSIDFAKAVERIENSQDILEVIVNDPGESHYFAIALKALRERGGPVGYNSFTGQGVG